MRQHRHPRCTCYNGTCDVRCQFHNKLNALLKLDKPWSESVTDTISQMREYENGRTFRRDTFTVEEILKQRAAKSKNQPHRPLIHNPFAKLREM